MTYEEFYNSWQKAQNPVTPDTGRYKYYIHCLPRGDCADCGFWLEDAEQCLITQNSTELADHCEKLKKEHPEYFI